MTSTHKKILIIEDEPIIRESIEDLLMMEQYKTITAENGQAGVRLAQEELPDLILCDIAMPEMDGHEVLATLRQDPKTAGIPFIFLTAKADKQDLRLGMEMGADDYLTKPFTPDELIRSIEIRLAKQAFSTQQAEQKLEELRHNITYALPHELHTPLNGIIGMSELLISDYDTLEPQEILEMAEDINASARRLYRLNQNFLLYAEMELMAHDPDRVQALRNYRITYPQNVISTAATQKAKSYNRVNDLDLELQDSEVYISDAKLKKIVDELIDNACKFSNPGTPIQILTSNTLQEGFVLYVIDEGRGMTPEQIHQVGAYMQFERRMYEQQGTGLGLVITKRLTELHGGTFTIESIPGKQTTVRITLPGKPL